MQEQSNARILAAELVGTTILMLAGLGGIVLAGPAIGVLGQALAFGFALVVMVYAIGYISGCHINPAVTLGMLLSGKVGVPHAVFAWIGQLIGGVFGAALVYGIASGADGFDRGSFGANGWGALSPGGYGLGSVIVVEVVMTAVLVFVVLTATNHHVYSGGMGGLGAGLTLAFVYLVTIPVDNGGVNPARSLGAAVFADTGTDALQQVWAFLLFPLVGAVVGVVVWLMVDEATLEDTMLDSGALRTVRDVTDATADRAVDVVEDAVD